jgi:hypothetical protein
MRNVREAIEGYLSVDVELLTPRGDAEVLELRTPATISES